MVQSFEGITSNLALQDDFEDFDITQEQLSVSARRVSHLFMKHLGLINFYERRGYSKYSFYLNLAAQDCKGYRIIPLMVYM